MGPLGDSASAPSTSTTRLPRLQAYYSSKNIATTETSDGYSGTWSKSQPLSKRLWRNCPGKAVEVDPFGEVWTFQPLTYRRTPHPYEMERFYTKVGPKDVAQGQRGAPWFGYYQQRWKRHWLPTYVDEVQVPEMTLDEIRLFLTKRFGSLRKAFDHLCFVRQGTLSMTEFNEGMFNLLFTADPNEDGHFVGISGVAFELDKIPRWMFNNSMKKLFQLMDADKSGSISFDEFSNTRGHPIDSAHEFTQRRSLEKARLTQTHDMDYLWKTDAESDIRSDASDSDKDSDKDTSGKKKPPEQSPTSAKEMFYAFLFLRFKSAKEAFKNFDLNDNGSLSFLEFADGARSMHFKGNVQEVFRALDKDNSGLLTMNEFNRFIVPSRKSMKKAKREARASRENLKYTKFATTIEKPAPMRRCSALVDFDIILPLGEKVSSSAGFYAFSRNPTRRLQLNFHPNEYPGLDSFNFKSARGPGTYDLPEETGTTKHVTQKIASKKGSNSMNDQCPRFMPLPSKEGREELANLAKAYASYPDASGPENGAKVCETGKVMNRVERYGYTFGADNAPALLRPPNNISNILKMNRLETDLRRQQATIKLKGT